MAAGGCQAQNLGKEVAHRDVGVSQWDGTTVGGGDICDVTDARLRQEGTEANSLGSSCCHPWTYEQTCVMHNLALVHDE